MRRDVGAVALGIFAVWVYEKLGGSLSSIPPNFSSLEFGYFVAGLGLPLWALLRPARPTTDHHS